MVSFMGQKSLGYAQIGLPRGLIENVRRASPPLSYAESPPPRPGGEERRLSYICWLGHRVGGYLLVTHTQVSLLGSGWDNVK